MDESEVIYPRAEGWPSIDPVALRASGQVRGGPAVSPLAHLPSIRNPGN